MDSIKSVLIQKKSDLATLAKLLTHQLLKNGVLKTYISNALGGTDNEEVLWETGSDGEDVLTSSP
ncbi:hypothetical protein HZS_2577 [Henneguya salminicola]|nr:hypothetical protein HZS_2577 [Henneguya salminicola]